MLFFITAMRQLLMTRYGIKVPHLKSLSLAIIMLLYWIIFQHWLYYFPKIFCAFCPEWSIIPAFSVYYLLFPLFVWLKREIKQHHAYLSGFSLSLASLKSTWSEICKNGNTENKKCNWWETLWKQEKLNSLVCGWLWIWLIDILNIENLIP